MQEDINGNMRIRDGLDMRPTEKDNIIQDREWKTAWEYMNDGTTRVSTRR